MQSEKIKSIHTNVKKEIVFFKLNVQINVPFTQLCTFEYRWFSNRNIWIVKME
jgi:hypothetical protein